jgi:hypothetical protein
MSASTILIQVPIVALLAFGTTTFFALLTGLIWLIRLEGRVNLRDALCNAQDTRTGNLEERILGELSGMRTEFRADMNKIFDKLDGKQDKS